jgi:hypothetical protein
MECGKAGKQQPSNRCRNRIKMEESPGMGLQTVIYPVHSAEKYASK